MVLTHGIPPVFHGSAHLLIPPTTFGSVLSLSRHENAYRWRSLPRVRRYRASSFQDSSSNGCSLFRCRHGPANVPRSFLIPYDSFSDLEFCNLADAWHQGMVGVCAFTFIWTPTPDWLPLPTTLSAWGGDSNGQSRTIPVLQRTKGRRSPCSYLSPRWCPSKLAPATHLCGIERIADAFCLPLSGTETHLLKTTILCIDITVPAGQLREASSYDYRQKGLLIDRRAAGCGATPQ